MQRTTTYRAGTVVTVRMRFADQSGFKSRPAVVISSDGYHRTRADAVIMGLTGQVGGRNRTGDCQISDWQQAGLVAPTKAKGVIETVARSAIRRDIGTLTQSDFNRVKDGIRTIFEL